MMKKLFALCLLLAACVHPVRAQSYVAAPMPKFQFFSNAGAPLAAGKVYTYQCGTTTPLATYADSSGTANANPIQLDSAGRATIYVRATCYKFILQNAAGVQIWAQDNVNSNPAGTITINTIPKGAAGGTLTDSRLTDDGTTIGLGSNFKVQTTGRTLIGLASTDVVGGSLVTADALVTATATSNAEVMSLFSVNGLYSAIGANKTGSGSYRPIAFFTNGSEAGQITTDHQLVMTAGVSSPASLTDVIEAQGGIVAIGYPVTAASGALNATLGKLGGVSNLGGYGYVESDFTGTGSYKPFCIRTSGLQRMCVLANGNTTLNTASPMTDNGFALEVTGTAKISGGVTTNLTALSVPYVAAGGVLTSDSASAFNWDATNHRILLGSAFTSSDVAGGALVTNGAVVVTTGTASASVGSFAAIAGSYVAIGSSKTGSGSYLPIAFFTSGVQYMTLGTSGGLTMGAPTGGDKGSGTINVAGDIYKQNASYTNPKWALESYFAGHADNSGPYAAPEGFTGLLPLDEHERFTRDHLDLPLMTLKPNAGLFDRGDLVLGSLEQAMIYIYQLNARIKALEAAK
jgi:hypothetical protein